MLHVWVEVRRAFCWGNLKEKCQYKDLDVDGKTIKFILIGWEAVGRVSLAQDDHWQAVVDVVQNLRFHRLEEIC